MKGKLDSFRNIEVLIPKTATTPKSMKETKAEIKAFSFRKNGYTYFIDVIATADCVESYIHRCGYHKRSITGIGITQSDTIEEVFDITMYSTMELLQDAVDEYEEEIEVIHEYYANKFSH